MGTHRSSVVEEAGKILVHLGGNATEKSRHEGAAPTLGKGRRMDWEIETSSHCRVRSHKTTHSETDEKQKHTSLLPAHKSIWFPGHTLIKAP